MPYTILLKTTRGSEKTDEIQRFKEAISIDVGNNYNKQGGQVVVRGKTYTYTVEGYDPNRNTVFATVDNK